MSHFDESDNPGAKNENNQQPTSDANGKKPNGSCNATAAGQCPEINSDGILCKAHPRTGSVYCFFHDPTSEKDREAARLRGGKERSRKAAVLPPDTPDRPLTRAEHVTALLAETINQVRRGEVDPRISNAVGYLAGILLKAKQQDELEQRLIRLESILANKWANPSVTGEPTPDPKSFEFVNPKPSGPA